MNIKIGFFTGARSDYGLSKKLIKTLIEDSSFSVKIYVSGMHLLKKFGYSYKEIIEDGFTIHKKIPTYQNTEDKRNEFTNSVNMIYEAVKNDEIDCAYIVGDRIEAYSAALALHFLKIPIFHYAGGQITKGAVDNIYRYNITNLSNYHFTTVKSAYERLKSLDFIKKENVFLTGSTSIDSIKEFLKSPFLIGNYIPLLNKCDFALMTFHPVTNYNENVGETMKNCIDYLLKLNYKILITYPNNDNGSQQIINVINEYNDNKNIIVVKNLTASNYYSAIYSSQFVIGNSSSLFIEVPYFQKISINIGKRQDGRESDKSVYNCSVNKENIYDLINKCHKAKWKSPKNEILYGEGNSCFMIKNKIINCYKDDIR
jgi:UDP-hydrolysing UDP-N-acetyl-D-glucosamine 2-epimerase